MAWAALIPIAAQLLGGGDKKEQAPAPQLPPPPTLGEIFSANEQKQQNPMGHTAPQFNPFSQIPIGGGSRGSNG